MLRSIDDVLRSLDLIIDESIAERSPLGYFAALYRRVTAAVKQAIESGAFQDNQRMEKLDIVFAQRYLDAYQTFRTTGAATRSWLAAFHEAPNRAPTVLQHLLLGMNAHISLDLGIAAAEVAENDVLSLKDDFFAINAILGSLVGDTQARLTRIFTPLAIVDTLLGSIDEDLSLFSIAYARDNAWTQTLELSVADSSRRTVIIESRDIAVANFAARLAKPNKLRIRLLLWLARLLERKDIASRIQILASLPPHA